MPPYPTQATHHTSTLTFRPTYTSLIPKIGHSHPVFPPLTLSPQTTCPKLDTLSIYCPLTPILDSTLPNVQLSIMPAVLPTEPKPPTKPSQGHPPPGPHAKRSTAMTQLLTLQDLLFQDACDDESKGRRFLSSRAWKELQELKLRLQMKPAPKPVDVSQPRKRSSRSGPAMPTDGPAPSSTPPPPAPTSTTLGS
jgi:hypothetical protein